MAQEVSKSLQLSVPHTKLPKHSESLSQSPSPMEQGYESVQQPESSAFASQPEVTYSQNVFLKTS